MGNAERRLDAEPAMFATPSIEALKRDDGAIILRSRMKLQPSARCTGEWLEKWARTVPDRTFLAERRGDTWTRLTYSETLAQVRAAAAWMLAHGLGPDRPLAILSDNSIAHGVLALAAQHVGVPVCAISPAYSLMSTDHEKLRAMIRLLDPGAIFVAQRGAFARALVAIEGLHRATIIAGDGDGISAVPLQTLIATKPGPDVDRAFAAVTPDTIAKLLFTSGSTGQPKAVINTHRMLTMSQQAKSQLWTFLREVEGGPVILDWLPWSHTFGANHNFNLVLAQGGSIHIDGGKPAPGLFETSLANLRSLVPTIYFNVPRGFDMLVTALKADDDLRKKFFTGVKCILYAAAALPQNLWDALNEMSMATIGRPAPLVSAWGATETSPLATDCHFFAERAGNIGVPIPGTELKLVPAGEKLEVRVRGPNVMPGYWKAPEITAAAFDDEGFYKIGDAVKLADPDHPERGLFFDGRITEDFKLSSGTWVNVGALRVAGIAALAPLAQDIVIAGHGTDEVHFLIVPNIAVCRSTAGLADTASVGEVLAHPSVREGVAQGLAKLRDEAVGSSRYATRALLMAEPPSLDAGEITDKGYINQRAVLVRRADLVARLQDDAASDLIRPGTSS
ncbi:feruloyl-CoA synthase [Bradyrhizobium sp. SSBR45G]|uniref:feruloyl-CoA synthase n=1 Tax=unclassified Bradyrhizobium TaxID=2631580 RepID=UPI002342A109|nr:MULTISPECIES: feruloyl-CoA synthase [unclassified Bradyrhizobium]GLH78450.1 feruloyl-CoA synthase [Bradyrhizobium sp. SSBR45G]GLH86233.1 feruloyl-CoA synthase [Bradyrhizobium sp. SSBR45R]